MIGKTLSRYKITGKLGEGGMGEVYRAEDTELDREVALKLLPADMADDAERLERFKREAKAVAALNHPNIVTIYNIEESDGIYFLTMELVEGDSLDKLIPAEGMPLAKLFDVAIPMADALAVYFIYPFLITMMAPALLGEKVGIRRFLAVLIGFAGSLLIIRPGFQVVPIGVYYVLGASVCFALFNVLTRRLTGMSDPWMTVFYQSIVGTVVLAVFVPANWRMPDGDAMELMTLMIMAAVIGHWLLVKAYECAPASLLAPFGYFEMISAVTFGYLWFDDLPDRLTWAGIAVIIATGVYISFRERKRKQTLRDIATL